MSHAARIRSSAVAALAALALAGCVVAPPQQASPPPQPQPSASEQPSAEPSATPQQSAYAYTTEATGADAWSFEPTSVTVVEADRDGNVAGEGAQLVILSIDAEILQGEPDFYTQFRVAAIDPDTADYYGLSSGTIFYAEDDLFTVGRQPSFQGAQAIFQVPLDWPLDTWYFLHHATGEQWFIEVPRV
ncbi:MULTISPECIES: hypothetical protein [unclassified Agrococcus]|uniref:hypothetical protein n=1 Tax=unclassified Agrococcus TaxID=2615065 RepID=UPI00360A0BF8